MVKSKIKPEIEYNESKRIDAEDMEYKTSVYEAEIHGKRVAIAVGKIKYTYTGREIIFYPVYLVSDNDVVKSQIGVFEMESKKVPSYLDMEGNHFNAEEFAKDGNGLLLYSFVDKEFLELAKSNPEFYKKKEEEKEIVEEVVEEEDALLSVMDLQQKHNSKIKEREKEEGKEIFETIGNAYIPDLLKEESKSDADALKNPSANSNWMQKFMQNDNYRIQDVSPNGDCFFIVVAEAFKQIGKKTTVERLRQIVADSATSELFEHYVTLYNMYKSEIQTNESKVEKISEKIKEIKNRYDKTTEKKDKDLLIQNIESMTNDKKTFKKHIAVAEFDGQHFQFMENVKSLEELKDKMKQTSYWADEFAISKLEEKLNVKMIILDEGNYKKGSEDAVMQCASGADGISNPSPEFYIMTSYTGDHYRLISYKDKKILKFTEIPYYIKTLIVNKCIERNAGQFHQISDFRRFQEKFGIDPVLNSYSAEPSVSSDLYDDTIHFMFYEKSADGKPGTGSGEKIGKQDLLEFNELRLVPGWRRMLDDESVAPFTLDGKQWQTVEHYYQASKFKKGFPNFYASFSLDSGSEICNDVKKAKGAGGKTGKFEKQLMRPKDVKIDADFYGGRDRVERMAALTAKFEENPDFKKVLLETKKAKLLHFIRGSEPEVDMELMELRATIRRP
jgi:predicted NAD-dependent protein-ADP-ribosyltransferase YbiA (DUF1768 family)